MEQVPETVTIRDQEIFQVGTHNGDPYSIDDLKAMVDAAAKVGFEPPLKLGHMSDGDTSALLKAEGMPSFGWIRNLRVLGQKLIGDLVEVPRRIADLIRLGAYKRVSAEIYWDFKKGNSTFPRVLKALALLGADIPAVTDLKSVEALYQFYGVTPKYVAGNAAEIRSYIHEMPMTNGGIPLKHKEDVNYREAESETGTERCGSCRFYAGYPEPGGVGTCFIVEGEIASVAVCDLFEVREAYEFDKNIEAKVYMIEKRGDEWCLLTSDGSKVLGCHPSKEEAEDQEKAIKSGYAEIRLSVAQVEKVCKPCAKKMRAKKIKELKLYFNPATKAYQGFNEGLCEAFAPGSGFRTRCMDSSVATAADDPGAICNALKQFCMDRGIISEEASEESSAHRGAGEEQMDPKTWETEKQELVARIKALEDGHKTKDEEIQKANARVQAVEDERRDEKIRSFVELKVREGKILPKEKDVQIAILRSASEEKTITFSDGKGGTKQMSQREALEQAIETRQASVVFTEVAGGRPGGETHPDNASMEDVGAEVDSRIRKYRHEHPQVNYQDALHQVLDADEDLKRRYVDQPTRR